MESYAIWNNKGGVGKTFLTYVLSTEYARKNPNKTVCVVDMCPQSNVSQLILGGNGKGIDNHRKFLKNQKSIADYIKQRYDGSRTSKLGSETSFFEQAHLYNKNIPPNIQILAGSNQLDLCSNLINYMATAPEKNAWQRSRLLLNDILSSFIQAENIAKKEVVFFIDCNPSFSAYTELAVLAATRLIIPCTADAASAEAIESVFRLLYGVGGSQEDVFLDFYNNVEDKQIPLPKVHLTILNKSRSYEKEPSSAFRAHSEKISTLVDTMKTKYSKYFTAENKKFYNVKDGNTLATVLSFEGQVLSTVNSGPREIYGNKTQITKEQIDAFIDGIDPIIDVI